MTTARLPLFPLNSVLFPGLVLPLNVFEERYRAMMRDLSKGADSGDPADSSGASASSRSSPSDPSDLSDLSEEEPRRFVVVAIRDGREVAATAPGMPDATSPAERGPAAGFGPDPIQAFHQVGCIADAATIRELEDGGYEVLATGTTRVRLLSVDASGPYLTAEVEELPEEQGEDAGALAEGVLRAFRGYQKRLAGARERSLATGAELPDEPSVVSYLVAAATVLDVPARQRLLQAPDTATRLREELKLLRTETAVIRHLPSLPATELTRKPTSPN
ncbi:LON peptidase substrate-binding domain-containing protein [Streptomyces sp. NPDC003016]